MSNQSNPRIQLNSDTSGDIDEPSLEELEQLVLRLNGKDCSDIILYRTTDEATSSLVICGGVDGRVTAILQMDEDESFLHLCDVKGGSAEFEQSIGGVATPLPIKYCVDKRLALQAARTFFEFGIPDSALHWE